MSEEKLGQEKSSSVSVTKGQTIPIGKRNTQESLFDFTVKTGNQAGNTTKYSFLCDKNKHPIKIGDGTFGTVFRVRGADLKLYAVKILYSHSRVAGRFDDIQSNTIATQDLHFAAAKDRFNNEVKAMLRIRKSLKEKLDNKDIGSIVEHIGYTDEFPEKKLEREQDNTDLSSHALVLEYYHGTLKDLLETKNESTGLSGYEALRTMGFEERIRTILPFLRGIADGLHTMHDAGYVHLDIKPANIFWQDSGDEIKAAIGDLGYIREFRDSEPIRSESQVALGTLHYRSPEQKDFQDTCEVKILKQDKDKNSINLRTSDPKFNDTIIEEGDNLQFLKCVTRDFKIKRVEKDKDTTIIQISNPYKDLKMPPDNGTQVKIFKNQGVRTDIYGFGAIAYDLITCGKSPERFYNYLAMYDRKDSKNEGVQTIINSYLDIETHSRRDSIYSSVFEHFHDQEKHKYIPSSIVSLILKSMLYHLKGTYYSEQGDKAFETIKEELLKLDDEYGGVRQVKRNGLIIGKKSEHGEPSNGKIYDLRQDIDIIQKIGIRNEGKSTLLTRIYRSTLMFDQLTKLIRDNKAGLLQQDYEKHDYTKEDKNKYTKYFFAELTPELISVANGGKLEFKSKVYDKMTEYISDLWKNRISGKLIYYSLEPFSSHDLLGDMKRRIELYSTEHPNEYRYKFIEASILGDNIKTGDWIVVHLKEVRRISTINKGILTLYPAIKTKEMNSNVISDITVTPQITSSVEVKSAEAISAIEENNTERYYYRNIDPILYYASMLAVYIYQLFFVGLGANLISIPSSVKSVKAQLESSPSMQKSIWVLLKKSLDTKGYKGRNINERVTRLYRRLAAFYLILTLTNQKAFLSKYRPTPHATEIESLVAIWLDILSDVEKCLKINPGQFTDHQETAFEELQERLEKLKINEKKIQIDLTLHFQNMLKRKK